MYIYICLCTEPIYDLTLYCEEGAGIGFTEATIKFRRARGSSNSRHSSFGSHSSYNNQNHTATATTATVCKSVPRSEYEYTYIYI